MSRVVSRVTITCYEDGSLQVEGPIDQKEYTLAVLANAADSVRNHRLAGALLIPGKDVSLPTLVGG
jgi:hypothetical protein